MIQWIYANWIWEISCTDYYHGSVILIISSIHSFQYSIAIMTPSTHWDWDVADKYIYFIHTYIQWAK